MTETERSAPTAGYLVYVAPAVLYVGAVFYAGLARAPDLPAPEVQFQDKIGHALAFGLMTYVLHRAIRFLGPKLAVRRALLVSFVLASALGGLLELVQLATSYRSAELLDFLADAVGAGIVAGLIGSRLRAERE